MKSAISRRSALSVLATSPLLTAAASVCEASSPDCHLLALGREFTAAAAKLDYAIAARIDFDDEVIENLNRLETEIVWTQATTMEGLSMKARAACWALLGDLDEYEEVSTDKRMMLSIVRDLIRLYDPALEKPGAITRLIQSVEADAKRSVTAQSTQS
jgi:hypothetical protein